MTSRARWDGLDLVRAAAMLLGLAYHAVYAYVPGVGPYYPVADHATSAGLASLGAALHAFRMELFFTLAGFFAHLLVVRRGADGFLRDRARRLLMPFAVALPLSITADLAVRAWARRAGAMSSEYPVPETVRLVPAHLWFLEYLFLFCAVTWAAVKVLEHRSGRPGRRPDAPGPPSRTWTLRFPAALLLLAVPTAVGLVLAPEPRPDLSFVPQAAVVAHHGLFFAAGFALYAARASLPALRPWWWLLPVGLGLAAFVFTRPLQWQPAGHALTGLVAWLATLGALGLALRLEPGERPWLRLLVDASYWVYLVHYPLVVALQVLLSPLSWPALLKYAVVVLATLGLTLGSFVAFVRRSPLAPWLGVRGAKT